MKIIELNFTVEFPDYLTERELAQILKKIKSDVTYQSKQKYLSARLLKGKAIITK